MHVLGYDFGTCQSQGYCFQLFCVKTAPLCQWGAKTVPLLAPNYGQPNSTPTGCCFGILFLSEGMFTFEKGPLVAELKIKITKILQNRPV